MATTMRAAARSAKFAKFLANRALWSQGRRTYLSAQYSCEKEWEESTKKDPLLQNVETDRLIVDVTRRVLNKTETNIGLDVDLLVHSFNNKKALSELANTLNRWVNRRISSGRRKKYNSHQFPQQREPGDRFYNFSDSLQISPFEVLYISAPVNEQCPGSILFEKRLRGRTRRLLGRPPRLRVVPRHADVEHHARPFLDSSDVPERRKGCSSLHAPGRPGQ